MTKLEQMLKEWNDPLGYRDVSAAEDLIHELQVELAGKEAVIKMLQDKKILNVDTHEPQINNGGRMMEINKKIHNLLHTRLCSPTTLIRKYKNAAKANNFPFSVFGILGERLPENPEDIYCPVCGYYCLGKGGFDCIDKPALVEQLKRRKQVDTDADQE